MATLREILKGKIPEQQLARLKLSYDVVGDIAVMNAFPPGMKRFEKAVAQAIMKTNKPVKTVVKKTGPTAGEKRIRPVKHVLGERRTETTYIENGCRFRLDINKVYFSPRLGHERLRVTNQVKEETLLDMFAGVGVFSIPAAKRAKKVIAVDLNKAACRYLEENARINRVSDKIEIYCGDVRKIAKKKRWPRFADRIIMNLPMYSGKFLDLAFRLARKGAVVHFYHFLPEKELFDGAIELIQGAAKKAKRRIKILEKRKCGQLSPRVWRVVVDFKIMS
jgi:tRNA (guanine37-N1)-methyltransferase